MLESLVMTMVTLPAFADSEVLSNLSAPLGSAASFRVWPPPPPPDVDELVVLVFALELLPLPLLEDELSSSPPHPATGMANAQRRTMREKARIEGSTYPSEPGFSRSACRA